MLIFIHYDSIHRTKKKKKRKLEPMGNRLRMK
jgi:hypothetical protein